MAVFYAQLMHLQKIAYHLGVDQEDPPSAGMFPEQHWHSHYLKLTYLIESLWG